MRHERSIETSVVQRGLDSLTADAETDLGAALAACVIQQALADALWTGKNAGQKSRSNDCREQDRRDAIDFFAGVVDPILGDDAVWGDGEQLMTLEHLCQIGGFDFAMIRRGALAKIRAKSPEHEDLLEAALAVARNKNNRKTL